MGEAGLGSGGWRDAAGFPWTQGEGLRSDDSK
jgi:hypothetical protein